MISGPRPDETVILIVPETARTSWLGYFKIVLAVAVIAGGAWVWRSGLLPKEWFGKTKVDLRYVAIDQGDVELAVLETGTVESANNSTVRCQVEALLGMLGGVQGAVGTAGASSASSGSAQGSTSGGSATGGAGGAQTTTTKKAGSTSKTGTTSKTTGSTGSTSGSSTSGSTGSTSGGSSSSSSSMSTSTSSASTSGSSTTTTTSSKPVIRSFTYVVTPYVVLRPVSQSSGGTVSKKQAQTKGGGGGGGGRGGGGGGGRGGAQMLDDEKAGSTRVVEIVPEGQRVKKGDVVCRLDSSAYDDEEKAQQIRYYQAKSYVDQAQSILDVNEISLREYRDGIYPQDLQLLRQYIQTCQLEFDRAQRTVVWSRDMLAKGFRTPYQTRGDELALEQAQIALAEAKGMLSRLVEQTGPKLLKSLEANVKAALSDKLTQTASYSLETQRLARLRKNIEYCVVRSPRDGLVVYANQSNAFGRSTAVIDQGVTLRQDQPIFNIPDPEHMRVKAQINESKVVLVHPGTPALISIDAYPGRPLRGRVTEVVPISTQKLASDVRIYYASVEIIDALPDLRPGLSAEITLQIDAKRGVTRVPVDAIRWVGDHPFVARRDPASPTDWSWRPITIGLSDVAYAEVVTGLEVGDSVVAIPDDLPDPDPAPKPPAVAQAAMEIEP